MRGRRCATCYHNGSCEHHCGDSRWKADTEFGHQTERDPYEGFDKQDYEAWRAEGYRARGDYP